MNDLTRKLARPCAIVAGLLVMGMLATPCNAQKRIGMPKDFDAAKKSAALALFSSGSYTAADQPLLRDFFQATLADLTNPDKAKDMHKTRVGIKTQLQTAGRAADQSTHDAANRFLVDLLPKVITIEAYHPAVRYNCALLLADLDSVEKKGFNDAATPLPAALDPLIQLLGSPKANDSVSLAAIVGLQRHALTADDAGRAKIAKATLAYLESLEKSDSAARKQDVKFWLEARAMETLGSTQTPSPETIAALQLRMADENRPIWVRCAASQAIGKLQFPPDSKIDANALFPDFKKLFENAADQGLNRRELRYAVWSLRRGLEGYATPPVNHLSALFKDAVATEAKAMLNAADSIAEICEDKSKSTVRVPFLVDEVVQKWRTGGISGASRQSSAEVSPDTPPDAEEVPTDGLPGDDSDVDNSLFDE
jgi:hypothetical protein